MKWYDYVVAVWFSYAMSSMIVTYSFGGLALQIMFYLLYENARKEQEHDFNG